MAVRVKTDELIEQKRWLSIASRYSSFPPVLHISSRKIGGAALSTSGSFSKTTALRALSNLISATISNLNPVEAESQQIEFIGLELEPGSQAVADRDDSVERAIALVDEWMNEESGYDEQTYPQIKSGLNQNRLSL